MLECFLRRLRRLAYRDRGRWGEPAAPRGLARTWSRRLLRDSRRRARSWQRPFSADIVVRDVEGRTRNTPSSQETRRLCPAGRRSGEDHRAQRRGNGGAVGTANPSPTGTAYTWVTPYSSTRTRMRSASFFEQLHELVNRDHLTGLLSKGRFDREFEHRLEAMADEGRPLSVLMADMNSPRRSTTPGTPARRVRGG